MVVEVEHRGRWCRIAIAGAMSKDRMADLRPQITGPLGECDAAEIDLSGIDAIDSAGLQLLLLLRRDASVRGQQLEFVNHSPAVTELLQLCSLDGYLGANRAGSSR